MPKVYIHLSDESSKILLEKRGLLSKKDKEISTINKSKICVNCQEPNRPEAQWCISCKMILSYVSYKETLEKQKQKDNDIEELKRSVAFLADKFNSFLASQPGNKILYDDNSGQSGIVKGIELKPELNHKAVGKVVSSNSNKKK